MIGLDNMQTRLQYAGGKKQKSRMVEDKLRSLKKSLLSSYQSATMVVENPYEDIESETLEFLCLINPDKKTLDEDKKMLSVPFKDVCLNIPRAGKTSEGQIQVPISCGDVFIWKETGTRWIVLLQYLNEYAYFRADIRKCFPYPLEIDGKEYWFASVGENEISIEWLRKNREEWNKLNYTRTLYIKRNKETFDYFKRFKIVNIPNIYGELEPWEVQAVNPNSVDDVITVHLKEYFKNQFEDISKEEQEKIQEEHENNEDLMVYVYDSFHLRADYIPNAEWTIENKTSGLLLDIDAIIGEDNTTIATIQLMNGKTGEFDVLYGGSRIKHVVVKSI